MDGTDAARPTRAARLKREVETYAIATCYLAISFAAILFHENAILAAHGLDGRPYWFVIPKAMILAKFMMVGDALKLGAWLRHRTVVHEIAWRAVSLAILLIILVIIEEIISGAIHGRSVAQSVAALGGGTAAQRWASMVLLLLIIIPYVAARVVAREFKARAAAAEAR
jgi:hypothetical protein